MGEMVLLGFVLMVMLIIGLDCVMYYNGYFIVELNGSLVLGYSFD